MRFSSFTLLITVAQALAAPSQHVRRQATVGVVQGYVADTSAAVNVDTQSLATAVANSANDVSAQVELVATAKADLADIAEQFASAAASIEASISALASTLSAPEVTAYTATVQAADTLIVSLNYNYNLAVQAFTAASQQAVQKESAAAAAAVQLFSAPLVAYAGQVQQIGDSSGSSNIADLQAAASSLASASNNFSGAVGVAPSS